MTISPLRCSVHTVVNLSVCRPASSVLVCMCVCVCVYDVSVTMCLSVYRSTMSEASSTFVGVVSPLSHQVVTQVPELWRLCGDVNW